MSVEDRKQMLRAKGYSEAMLKQAQQADPDLAKTIQRLGQASPQNRSATIPATK